MGTASAYGRGLEFGTRRVGARPWLRPAVERVRRGVRQITQMILMETLLGGRTREELPELVADIPAEED